jgi:hypothetical protein
MIVPPKYPNPASGDRLAGRSIRIGLKVHSDAIVEQLLPPDANIVFGAGGADVVTVPGWTDPHLCLLSRGRWLALGPGMSLIMCHESGEDRMEGTFEELSQAGVSFPLYINVSRLNIRVQKGVVMLMEYMKDAS